MPTRSICRVMLLALLASAVCGAQASAPSLTIYFIDVEGGQSTLIVTPQGHSLLIDAGWAGDGAGFHVGDPRQARDANRIVAAVRDAGLSQIDYLLVTHFHIDHDGGVTELSGLIPIRGFIDHGAPSEDAVRTSAETGEAFAAYLKVRGAAASHWEPGPGDRLPLKDVEAIVVSSAGKTLVQPLPGGGEKNQRCAGQAPAAADPYENPRSTGVVIRYGRFRFLDVGDLTGQPLFDLACPKSLIGPVAAYLVAHHGGADAGDPSTLAAFKPRVAIMNNGLRKGGARTTYEALHRAAGLEDVWQLHWSADAGDSNFAAPTIANPDESTSYWIKLVARPDGSFRILNQRTGAWKAYPARP